MEIGTYCHLCKQLDFLPFKCNKCHHHYCLKHYPSDKHECLSNQKSNKQLCKKNTIKCHLESCRKKTITPYFCKKCNKYYCLIHRFHDLHKI